MGPCYGCCGVMQNISQRAGVMHHISHSEALRPGQGTRSKGSTNMQRKQQKHHKEPRQATKNFAGLLPAGYLCIFQHSNKAWAFPLSYTDTLASRFLLACSVRVLQSSTRAVLAGLRRLGHLGSTSNVNNAITPSLMLI